MIHLRAKNKTGGTLGNLQKKYAWKQGFGVKASSLV